MILAVGICETNLIGLRHLLEKIEMRSVLGCSCRSHAMPRYLALFASVVVGGPLLGGEGEAGAEARKPEVESKRTSNLAAQKGESQIAAIRIRVPGMVKRLGLT